jgi:heme exporter protein C
MKRGFTILAIVTALLLSFALYEALVAAPTERTMGDVQRIFYYHVPSAWTAFLLFLINFVASLQYLIRSKQGTQRVARLALYSAVVLGIALLVAGFIIPFLALNATAMAGAGLLVIVVLYLVIERLFSPSETDVLALASAEVGVVFCTVVLVTGPIWARPVWGIWWTWDMRLTLTLVLWLIYVSYLVLRRFSTSSQTPVLAAVLAVFGAIDVPLVYFSIWFFRTQHPSPVIGGGGSLDPRMARVLLINWVAFLCLAWLVCWTRYRLEVAKRQVEESQAMQSLMDGSR